MLALAAVLTILSLIGVRMITADARIDLLVDPSSPAFLDQARVGRLFGADPVVVLVEPAGNGQLLSPDHMLGLARLEGELAREPGVRRVYGPGTLINTLATEVTRIALDTCGTEGKQAEDKARQQAIAAGKSQADQDTAGQTAFEQAVRVCAQRIAAQYPSLGVPALNNPVFYDQVLLEPDGRHVRPFWTWAMPDPQHAVITARLDPNASLEQVHRIIGRARSAAAESGMRDLRFVPSGGPALTASLADAVLSSLVWLIPLALIAIVVVALAAARALAVLPLAALACLWTAGLAGLLHRPITPATVAVIPVVIGLSTDYFIQLVNRTGEEGPPGRRAGTAAARILPSTGLAALATGAGVLAFAVSPIPLVRQFGVFMALGVAMAYLANLLVGVPIVYWLDRRVRLLAPAPVRGARAAGLLSRAGRLSPAIALGLIAVASLGWAALPGLRVETDPVRLMPAGDPALASAAEVQRKVGLTGEMDLVLTGPDVTQPDAVLWLTRQTVALSSGSGGDLRPVQSLPEFLAGFNDNTLPDAKATALILQRIPAYFSGAVVSRDHHTALSILGLTHLTSVERDRVLVDQVSAVAPPPSGDRSFPAGLAVVAVSALTQVQQDQVPLTALTLLVVALVLGAAYRRPVPVLLVLLPTVAAGGAGTALLLLERAQSNPMTVLLGGVVIAFATEFGVLWLGRYRLELAAGSTPDAAARIAGARISPAILASALALIAGFAVLGLSPVPAVQEFGTWSAIDLALAAVAVLVLLPALARSWLTGLKRAPRVAASQPQQVGEPLPHS